MQSFLQYRKNKLQRTIPNLPVQEALNQHFDILRLELLEAVELPPILFEFNLVTESAYEAARKEDYNDIKEILEFVISQYKCNFYQQIINEASSPVAALNDLKKTLEIEVQKLVDDLKSVVQGILSSARPTSAAAASADAAVPVSGPSATGGPSVAPRGVSSDKQKNYIRGLTASLGLPTPDNLDSMSVADATRLIDQLKARAGSGSPQQSTGGRASPVNAGGPTVPSSAGNTGGPAAPARNQAPNNASGLRPFQPAPYGHMRPSDGWLSGLKRTLVDPVTGWVKNKWRNFRRRWHNDPMREHAAYLESIFVENAVDVSSIIDKFKSALVSLVNTKIDDIITSMSGSSDGKSPDSGPSAGPASQSSTLELEPRKAAQLQAAGVDPKDVTSAVDATSSGNPEVNQIVADRLSDIVAPPSDDSDDAGSEEQKPIEENEKGFVQDAVSKLGLRIENQNALKRKNVNMKELILRKPDGTPFEGEQQGGDNTRLYLSKVEELIRQWIDKNDPNYKKNHRTRWYATGKKKYVEDAQKLALTWSWLLEDHTSEKPHKTNLQPPNKLLEAMVKFSQRTRNFKPEELLQASGEMGSTPPRTTIRSAPQPVVYPNDDTLEEFAKKFQSNHPKVWNFLQEFSRQNKVDINQAMSGILGVAKTKEKLAKDLLQVAKAQGFQETETEPKTAQEPQAAQEPEAKKDQEPEAAQEPEAKKDQEPEAAQDEKGESENIIQQVSNALKEIEGLNVSDFIKTIKERLTDDDIANVTKGIDINSGNGDMIYQKLSDAYNALTPKKKIAQTETPETKKDQEPQEESETLADFEKTFKQKHQDDGLWSALEKTAKEYEATPTELIKHYMDSGYKGELLEKELISKIKESKPENSPEEKQDASPEEKPAAKESSKSPYDQLQENEEYKSLIRLMAQKLNSKDFENLNKTIKQKVLSKEYSVAQTIEKLKAAYQQLSKSSIKKAESGSSAEVKPAEDKESQVEDKESEDDKKTSNPSGGFDFSQLESDREYTSNKKKLVRLYADNSGIKDDETATKEAQDMLAEKEKLWRAAVSNKEMGIIDVLDDLEKLIKKEKEKGDNPDNWNPQRKKLELAKGNKKGSLGGSLKMGDDDKMAKEGFHNTLNRFLKLIRS